MEDIKIVYQGVEYYRSKKLAKLLHYNTPASMLLYGTKFADGRQGNRAKVSKEHILYLPYSLNSVYGFSICPKGEYFVTEEGAKEFIINSQTLPLADKQQLCNELGFELNVVPYVFSEVEFGGRLQKCIEDINENLKDFGVNITIEKQKRILNHKYRLDYYLPEVNLAIEYDEMSTHWDKTEEDQQREREIKEVIKDIQFIRVHQNYDDKGIIDIVNFIYRYVFVNRRCV